MDGNERDEHARRQVASGNEEALGPAGFGVNQDGVAVDPGRVEGKGNGLVQIGDEQVVDENEKLVGRALERTNGRARVLLELSVVLCGGVLRFTRARAEDTVNAQGKVHGVLRRGCLVARSMQGRRLRSWGDGFMFIDDAIGLVSLPEALFVFAADDQLPCNNLIGEVDEKRGRGKEGDAC